MLKLDGRSAFVLTPTTVTAESFARMEHWIIRLVLHDWPNRL